MNSSNHPALEYRLQAVSQEIAALLKGVEKDPAVQDVVFAANGDDLSAPIKKIEAIKALRDSSKGVLMLALGLFMADSKLPLCVPGVDPAGFWSLTFEEKTKRVAVAIKVNAFEWHAVIDGNDSSGTVHNVRELVSMLRQKFGRA
jgi:hypothetical protein